MLFETLEQRKLMSVSLIGNSLEIRGTEAADNYSISSTGVTLKVVENGTTYNFAASSVARINALLFGGDDTFNTVGPSLLSTTTSLSYASLGTTTSYSSKLSTSFNSLTLLRNVAVYTPMIVDGGYGNDRITTGYGNDTIQGNAGNDYLYGGAGNDLMDGGIFGSASGASNYGTDWLFGEDGNDTLHASDWGKGNLFGGNGNDSIYGYWGNDYLDGGAGNDYMSGYRGNDIMNGGSGDDTMQGGGGTDQLYGMEGNDVMDGGTFGAGAYSDNDGADMLRGGAGNDILHASDYGNNRMFGDDGDDKLFGYGGADYLNGGAGSDEMNGGAGNDVLIGIDGGANDKMTGGSGIDIMWGDRQSFGFFSLKDTVTDASSYENARTVKSVSSFANGADKTLNGDNIADPTDGTNYKNFSSNPLFAPGGPSANDVDQESAADCWILAPLGAIAQDNPWRVKGMVVDLGDGTYGVSLGSNFYRVDADLPTWNAASTDQRFAGLGQSNSLWVAIVEKAYTHHRTGANTYNSIGWGDPADAMRQFNAGSVGQKYFNVSTNGTSVANEIYSHWNAYQGCTICTGSVGTGSPLVGGHCYTVTSVSRNSSGQVTSVRVRNPWGGDNTGGNPFVDLTPSQLAACQIWVTWGTL